MRNRRLLVAALLALLLAATAPGLAPEATQARTFEVIKTSWASPSGPEDPRPGSFTTLEVTLRFNGRVARGLVARLVTSPPFFNLTMGDVVEVVRPGVVQTGETLRLYFGLWVSPDAPPGFYSMRLRLEWSSGLGLVTEEDVIRTELKPPLSLEVEAKGSLTAGRMGEVVVLIWNNGLSGARGVTASVSGGSLLNPGTTDLGDLEPGEVRQLVVRMLPRASPTPYLDSLRVGLSYVDQYGRVRSDERLVNVLVSPPLGHVGLTAVDNEVVGEGESEVELVLRNTLDEGILEAVVRLSPGQGLHPLKQLFIINTLPAGSEARLSVPVWVQGGAQVATMQYVVEYQTDQGSRGSLTGSLSFRVVGTVERDLVVGVEPTELPLGSLTKLSLRLKAVSSIESLKLSLDVVSQGPSIIGPGDVWVGDMSPGELVEHEVVVNVPVGSGPHTKIRVRASYLEETGRPRQEVFLFSLMNVGEVRLRLVDYVVSPASLSPGQPFSLTGTILNEGSSDARFVFITPLVDGTPFELLSRLSGYVGGVEVGVPVSFTIPLRVSDDAPPGPHELKLRTVYTNILREEGVEEFVVRIRVEGGGRAAGESPEARASPPPPLFDTTILTLALVLTAGVLGYVAGRRLAG